MSQHSFAERCLVGGNQMSSCRGMLPVLTQLHLVMLCAPKLRQLQTWVNYGNYSSSPQEHVKSWK